jgi:hypothetical protein
MSRNTDASNVSRREFLTAAGTVAAVTSLPVEKTSSLVPAPVPPAPAVPADYIVKVDAKTKPFSYVDGAGKPAYHLNVSVAAGSRVAWQATSPHSNKHCVAILFPKETPLVDTTTGRPLYAVLWSEIEESSGPTYYSVDPDASGHYEYTVVVFDRESGATQSDDPKMIVGSGNLELKVELTSVLGELREVQKALSGKPSVEKQAGEIESVERKLEGIIKTLK